MADPAPPTPKPRRPGELRWKIEVDDALTDLVEMADPVDGGGIDAENCARTIRLYIQRLETELTRRRRK